MRYIRCEDNLAGFLTAVYKYYYDYGREGIIAADMSRYTLTDTLVSVGADTELARKVRAGIVKKIGSTGYKEISDAYLSSDPLKEDKILNYLILVFKHGRSVYGMFSEPGVIAFNDMLNKVRHEVHRLHGFLRFQELDSGVYYSFFSGDHDVIELLIPHFKARFNAQPFVLHDVKRSKMIFYDGGNTHKLLAPESLNITVSEREIFVSELWKQYHVNVNIENRRNIRTQNQFLPKKYRWFMNEF
jgi:probable DNA metabolism protein